MPGGDPALATALHDRVHGDDLPLLENAQLMGQAVHFDDAPTRTVGHAVEIAADGNHTVAGDPPLEPQNRLENSRRQRLQHWALLGEVLDDDTVGGGMRACVGDLVEPLAELPVQVIEVAEAAGEEEILAHVAEGPLHLAFGLGPVGPAGLGQ